MSSALWVAPCRKTSSGTGELVADFGTCRIASRSRSRPRLISPAAGEFPAPGVARASWARFTGGALVPLPGSRGRAFSLPSPGRLDALRRHAELSASEATAPPAIVQKLRLLSLARLSFIVGIHRLHSAGWAANKRLKLRRSRMFIATTMRKGSKLRRSETRPSKLLRSYGALELKEPGVYKHFIPAG